MQYVIDLLPHQDDLIYSTSPKSCMVCGRGAGKTFTLSYLALRDFIQGKNVLIGAQSVDSLHDGIWAELKARAEDAGLYDMIEWRERPLRAYFNGATIYTGTYESVDAKRSGTKVATMILDELFLAPINILSVWGPVMRDSGFSPRIVAGTTPRKGSMWNTIFASPDCPWEIIKATSKDNPHISDEEYSLFNDGMINDEMRRQELMGEIITDNADMGLVSIADFPTAPADTTDERVLAGLDMSGGGERDAHAFFARKGNRVLDVVQWHNTPTETVVAHIREFHRKHPISKLNMDLAWSESAFDQLKYEIPCEQVPFGRSAENQLLYANVRAEMYFNAARAVKEGLCVNGFELTAELKRELCAMTWVKNGKGQFLIAPKDDLRITLGRSPDIADAMALTCLTRYRGDLPKINREAAVKTFNPQIMRNRRRACSMMG